MSFGNKINIVLLVLVVIPFFGVITVNRFREPRLIRFSNANIRRYGKDGREMPSNTNDHFAYRVESPIEFDIDGKHVRLLGIKEPIEEERRQDAVKFVENWLEDARNNVVWFSNWSQALQDDSGTWLVWATALRGIRREYRCLNVDLIEAGLADVDYSEHLHYEFRQPEYGGLGQFVKWRELLDEAKKARSEPNP